MRYEPIEAKIWLHTSGRTASIYGSAPWYSDKESANWSMKFIGYTIVDTSTNTIGLGRKVMATLSEAQQTARKLNERSVSNAAI